MAEDLVISGIRIDTDALKRGEREVNGALKNIEKQADRTERATQGVAGTMGSARNRVRSWTNSIKANALALGLVAGGAALVGKRIFEVGSRAAETQSKFDTVFGAMSRDVQDFLDTFGRMAGLSKQQGQELIATTAAIAQGMGFARDESAGFSQEVLRLAADLASFNNLSTEDTLLRINAALTGERESLKRLGVVIRETEVQQRAMAMSGKDNARALTQQEKAAATLEIATEKAGVALGDLERTQDSAANTARQVEASLRSIEETISTALLPAFASLLTFLQNNVIPVLEWFAEQVRLTFDTFNQQALVIQANVQGVNQFKTLAELQAEIVVSAKRRADALKDIADLEGRIARVRQASGGELSGREVVLRSELKTARETLEVESERLKTASARIRLMQQGIDPDAGPAAITGGRGGGGGVGAADVDEVARALERLEEDLRGIEAMEAALAGTSVEFDAVAERARAYRAALDALARIQGVSAETLARYAAELDRATRKMAEAEEAARRMEELQALAEGMAKKREQARKSRQDAAAAELEAQIEQQRRMAERMADSFADSFASIITGTQSVADAFRSMAQRIIAELVRIQIQEAIIAPLLGSIGGDGGVKGAAASAASAKRAAGGPISAGQAAIVGERGPELFMPNRSGTVVPNNRLGGGGGERVEIHAPIHFNTEALDGPSVQRVLEQHAPSMARMVVGEIERRGALRNRLRRN